jgi:hypothetical protein
MKDQGAASTRSKRHRVLKHSARNDAGTLKYHQLLSSGAAVTNHASLR